MAIDVPIDTQPFSCNQSPQPKSPPFLAPPYHGYAEITSYFDHDDPDYSIDGRMTLANGLRVTGAPSPGAWPAYWSPVVRQWINYDGHNGYDYDISYQPVYAAAAGEVVYADWESADPYFGFGQMILIHHVDGYETLYGHLSRILVHPGEQVSQGQEIGISGTTGHSTGPHLHFSVYHNCHVMDPYGWSGKGEDPLVSYNGETSTYIWKNGHSPLVLNPLPNWPTFASTEAQHTPGTSSPTSPTPSAPGLPQLPSLTFPSLPVTQQPLKHLLLLKLPDISHADAPTVLSTYKAYLDDEQVRLLPVISSLKEQGLISSATVLPDLGGVSVTGRLSPQYLLGLPGVASITGARPRDVAKAKSAYEGAMAAALRMPAAPSIFPAGDLDAVSLWRLNLSVDDNGSYVLGFTQPGARVKAVLTRGSSQVAWGTGTGDPRRGAFVLAMLDATGKDARITPGDVLHVSSDGRSARVSIGPLTISSSPDSGQITIGAPRNTRPQLVVRELMTKATFRTVVKPHQKLSPKTARDVVKAKGLLTAGDVLTSRIEMSSGTSLFAWSRAPGLSLSWGSPVMNGWGTGGIRWRATVFSGNGSRASAAGRPDTSGWLQLYLKGSHGRAYTPKPGDRIEVRAGSHISWLTVPSFRTFVSGGRRRFSIEMEDRAQRRTVSVTKRHHNHKPDLLGRRCLTSQGRLAQASNAETFTADLRNLSSPAFSLVCRMASGDEVNLSWANRGLIIHPNAGTLTGTSTPGQAVIMHVFGPHRHLIAASVALAGESSGAFVAKVANPDGSRLVIRPGDTITVSNGMTVTRYSAGGLQIQRPSNAILQGETRIAKSVNVYVYRGGFPVDKIRVTVRNSRFAVKLPARFRRSSDSLMVEAGTPATSAVEVAVPPVPSAPHLVSMGIRAGRAIPI